MHYKLKMTLKVACLGLLIVGVSGSPLLQAAQQVRNPVKAGTWYPGTVTSLQQQLQALTSQADDKQLSAEHGKVRALIVPHAGYDYSGPTAAAAYRQLAGQSYQRVVVIGTAHHADLPGLSVMDVDAYRTPLGTIDLDHDAIATLRHSVLVMTHPYAHDNEHSIELQLPFLQQALGPGWQLVPILAGNMTRGQFQQAAELIRPLLDDQTLLVISGDFTHYGPDYEYLPFPLDELTAQRIAELDRGMFNEIRDIDPDGLAEFRRRHLLNDCAFPSVMILLNLLPADTRTTLIRYQTSGAVTGDYRNSVSYLAIVFQNPSDFAAADNHVNPATVDETLDENSMQQLHQLAVQAVISSTQPDQYNRQLLDEMLQRIPDELKHPSATFITLTRDGELRGCIGSILPNAPLYQSVVKNAVNAAIHDYRFSPVESVEVPQLTLEVSVLSVPKPIASWRQFEVGRHGIILEKDGHKAVYLPEVAAQQGWNQEQTLTHLSTKAGLGPDEWRQGANFKVFTTQTYTRPIMPLN